MLELECLGPNSSAERSRCAPLTQWVSLPIRGRLLFRLFVLGLLTGSLFSGCSQPPRTSSTNERQASQAVRPESSTVRLASWNVRNLFDSVDDANKDDVLSPSELQLKLRQTAGVLDKLDADFVALEEVENLDVLKMLNEALSQPYPFLGLIEGNDKTRGIDVAYLSRIPVEQTISHADYDLPDRYGVSRNYKFSRDCLEIRLATEPPLTIFVNHFKSQLGSKKASANKRRVQAEAVVELVRASAREHPEALEIVMGDLNDEPESWALEPLFSELIDVFKDYPTELRVTHRFRHGGSSLDHILLSKDAQAYLRSVQIWKDAALQTSDHDPVSVEIQLDRAPAFKTTSR